MFFDNLSSLHKRNSFFKKKKNSKKESLHSFVDEKENEPPKLEVLRLNQRKKSTKPFV